MKKFWIPMLSFMLVFALALSACNSAPTDETSGNEADADTSSEAADSSDEGSTEGEEAEQVDDNKAVATKIYASEGKFNDLFGIANPVSEDEDADLAMPDYFSTKDALKEHLLKYGTEEYVDEFIDTYFKEDGDHGLIVNQDAMDNYVTTVGTGDFEGNGLTLEGDEATFTVTNEDKEVTVTAKKDGDDWKIASYEVK